MKTSEENITANGIYSPELRKSVKRAEDQASIKKISRYENLFQVGQSITSEINFDVLFDVIIKETNSIMEVERCSIFLLDEAGEMLDAIASTGLGGLVIKVPKEKGIVGWVFNNRKPAIVNDVKDDPRFFSEIDKKSELVTNNILCVPLEGKRSGCIGALEIINSNQGEFNDSDCETLIHLSNYITIALENAQFYKKLKIRDRAKEKVINHLAHELTAPISILKSVIKRLAKALKKYEQCKAQKIEDMGTRNIQRLSDLQTKVADIIRYGPASEKEFLESLILRAADAVEGLIKEDNFENSEFLSKILDRIDSIYKIGKIEPEKIDITTFIEDIVKDVFENSSGRDIGIEIYVTPGLVLNMDKMVLRRILLGLIKNAIENTPDEGYIKIDAYNEGEHIVIDCIDNGIGITADSKDQIFSGFYHTQITDKYSTQKPFAFNAGGIGIDLLRAKIISDKLGFIIDFSSKRCDHILLGNYQCPGKISNCDFINENRQCHQSGGSTFSIKFPLKQSIFSYQMTVG